MTLTHRGAVDHEGKGGAASYLRVISGVVAGGTPLNFGLSENLLHVRNFLSKNANFEAEKLLFGGNLWSKLKL